jgi:hypothetical protein
VSLHHRKLVQERRIPRSGARFWGGIAQHKFAGASYSHSPPAWLTQGALEAGSLLVAVAQRCDKRSDLWYNSFNGMATPKAILIAAVIETSLA